MQDKQSGGTPSVAIVHDYLTQRGGAERVVLSLAKAFPDAPIYVTLYDPEATYDDFKQMDVRVSWLNRVPAFRKNHRLALPLLPFAAKSLRAKAAVVVASSSAFGHGVTTDGSLLVYCHTPPRFLYLSDEYLGSGLAGKVIGAALKPFKPMFRSLDQAAASRAAKYLANSSVVQRRITDVYGIEADLMFPPHAIDTSGALAEISEATDLGEDYCLLVSRLLPYKNVDKVVEAFRSLPNRKLLIVGSGPMAAAIRASLPANVALVSGITDDQMRWAYANARFLVAPSFEDFGLTVIEGAAWGLPAVTLGAGGYLDTVVPGVTGLHFAEPTPAQIATAVEQAFATEWEEGKILAHAASFSEDKFIERIRSEAALVVANR